MHFSPGLTMRSTLQVPSVAGGGAESVVAESVSGCGARPSGVDGRHPVVTGAVCVKARVGITGAGGIGVGHQVAPR